MKKSILSTLLLISSVTFAGAASAEPFNGPYVGAQAGLNHDKIGTLKTDLGDLDINRDKDSFGGGIYGGYDLKISPRVVLGVEAGVSATSSDAMTLRSADSLSRINPSHAFDLSARAGYLIKDDTLLYVRGGYENVRAKVTSEIGGLSLRDNDNFDGWMVGAGVERMITNAISARLEYRYSDLSGGDGKFERHQGLLGIAYRF